MRFPAPEDDGNRRYIATSNTAADSTSLPALARVGLVAAKLQQLVSLKGFTGSAKQVGDEWVHVTDWYVVSWLSLSQLRLLHAYMQVDDMEGDRASASSAASRHSGKPGFRYVLLQGMIMNEAPWQQETWGYMYGDACTGVTHGDFCMGIRRRSE